MVVYRECSVCRYPPSLSRHEPILLYCCHSLSRVEPEETIQSFEQSHKSTVLTAPSQALQWMGNDSAVLRGLWELDHSLLVMEAVTAIPYTPAGMANC